jgi:hypothetical protein
VAAVDRFVIAIFVRGLRGLLQVFAATGAWVSETRSKQQVEGFAIGGNARGLLKLSGPGDAQPAQVFAHGFSEFFARALRVEVFVAEQERAMVLLGALVSDPESARVSEVEQARG